MVETAHQKKGQRCHEVFRDVLIQEEFPQPQNVTQHHPAAEVCGEPTEVRQHRLQARDMVFSPEVPHSAVAGN